MSCLDFINKYAEEPVENQKDTILDETLDCLKTQENRRTQQLQDFIDDFVKSEEYVHYIEEKRAIIKRSAATQCDFNEIIVECKENERLVKYPLTEERKKMYAFKKHFELYAENLRKNETLKKQKYGIQVIKMKIHEAKRIFECTREFKEKEKKRTDQFLIQKYSAHFGIDIRTLSFEAQMKILDRFKKCHQKISKKNTQRQNNLIKIVAKLCQEEKLKKTKKKEFKINKREKIISDMEIVGTHIELIDRNEQTKVVEPSKEIQIETEESKEVNKETKKNKKEKSKKDKSDKSSKKKDKKTKEPKVKTPAKFVLPNIPIVNPRKKILPENIDDLVNIVEEFRDLDNAIENGGLNQIHPNHPLDHGLHFKPHEISFENFETDKSYNKKIIITNVSSQIRKVRFLCYEFEDPYDQIAFKLDPFGIQKLFTGCKFQFNLTFQPWDSNKLWNGKIIFVSYNTRSCQYYQSELVVRCLPKYSNLIIHPDSVSFGEIPIWKTYEHYKTIKFQNTGAKPCTISIRKIWDPLQIESILNDEEENKENIPPKSASNSMVEDILDECLKNVENNFEFTDGYFTLTEFDSKLVKVIFKNASYVGDYLEKFRVEVLERDNKNGILQSSGCQVITLNAETIGHFLSTHPEVIDFGICLIHTCYQTSFDICNNSQNTQAVSVKVPASLSEMVQTDVSMVYIGPKSRRTVLIKLIPRSNLLTYNDSPYFDKHNLILHFPVRLHGTTKTIQDYPPIKMPVYAIISNFEDLTISCNSTRNLSNFLNTILIDVGDCSIYETIWTEISVTNNTAVTQLCGFVNLPKCITLVPNFGFCKLHPGQRKKFKIYISPDIRDFPSYSIGSLRNSNYFFKIKVDTIIGLGKLALEDTVRETKNSSMDFAKKLTITDNEAFNSMTGLVSDIKQQSQFETTQSMINKEGNIMSRGNSILRSDFFPVVDSRRQSGISQTTNKREDSGDMDTLLNYHNFLIVETESRREVWCKVNIRRPWLEFSHQFVHFPDTPTGSYSTMEIVLQALEREIENPCARKKSRLEYKAYFQIAGGGQEILIEPSCGILSSGEFTKITLLVKPKIPNEIVEKVAKSRKYAEVYSRKLEQYQAALSKKQGKKGKTPKKPKKKQSKKTESSKQQADIKKDEQPNITVNDSELVIDSLDLFPAEMEYWRSLEPYYIKDNFTCILDYETPKGHRKKDRLYLEAICKVIRPDFIIDLNRQRIDFGNCLVGMKVVKTVKLQNITYKPIKPRVSLLNPLGPFSVPYFADLTVAPEEFFEIPITFKPTNTGEVIEYIEIQSNASIISLILCGQGNCPTLNLSPQFGVYRLETKVSKLAELQLKVENPSEAPATVHFDKLFEIEGLLSYLKPQKDQSTEPQISDKNKKKAEKSKKSKDKTPRSSDELTEEEVEAIGRAFKLSEGGPHIDFHIPQTHIELPPNGRASFTLVCGSPELIKKKQTQGPKEKKKKDKQESVKKSEISTIPDSIGQVKKVNDKQYIAQFNVKVGNEFIKSIVIICTIKG